MLYSALLCPGLATQKMEEFIQSGTSSEEVYQDGVGNQVDWLNKLEIFRLGMCRALKVKKNEMCSVYLKEVTSELDSHSPSYHTIIWEACYVTSFLSLEVSR